MKGGGLALKMEKGGIKTEYEELLKIMETEIRKTISHREETRKGRNNHKRGMGQRISNVTANRKKSRNR